MCCAPGGLAEQVLTTHGFEPAINCHSVRERVLQMLVSVEYDREVGGDKERSRRCMPSSTSLIRMRFSRRAATKEPPSSDTAP